MLKRSSGTWATSGAIIILGLGMCFVAAPPLWAQSGSRREPPSSVRPVPRSPASEKKETRSTDELPLEEKLWNYLQSTRYEYWAPLPGRPAEAYAAEEPHGASVKLFASRTAAASPKDLPFGSILVKHNLGSDQKSLMAVTVMYRLKNYDAKNHDWLWVKYEPDGRVARMNGMPVAGKVGMCIECHSSAANGDMVFSND